MPTNMYGPNDNYDLKSSHVLPAFIRKFHEAKTSKVESVTCWGTGNPLREFLYSDDLARGNGGRATPGTDGGTREIGAGDVGTGARR